VLWILNALLPRGGSPISVGGDKLFDALPGLTLAEQPVSARLEHAPSARERDWLAAIREAGTTVQWSGELAPVAIETYPAADPAGGAFMLVSAPGQASVADALGPIDTIETGGEPVTVRVGDARGAITLTSAGERARAGVAPASQTRRVIVAGAANWEAKFLIAALEEAGWQVDTRLRVRPDEVVRQGATVMPDTARHAAVVLLDSAASVPGLDAFARAGGGVVLVGDASRARVAAPLVAWRVARRETAPLGTLPGDTIWRGQSRVAFGDVDSTRAIALERRGDAAFIVARRHYAGRVLGVGYDGTWQWRMAGGGNSVVAHRAWWSRHVASVAIRSSPARAVVTGAAPLAALHASLGPSAGEPDVPALPRSLIGNLLGAVALAALLAEWLMRRLRGMK
jgi:hypothetical protein